MASLVSITLQQPSESIHEQTGSNNRAKVTYHRGTASQTSTERIVFRELALPEQPLVVVVGGDCAEVW